MSIVHALVTHLVNGAQDSKGPTTSSWIWPEKAELIFGIIASGLVFAVLFKFGGPPAKKAMAARTERIQKELDSAASDKAQAASEAAGIRQAKGDIGAERDRILAEARAEAEQMVADGAKRLDDEVAELQARAAADIAATRARGTDELRAEIASLTAQAMERAVTLSIDEATQQSLVEAFIQKVGAAA